MNIKGDNISSGTCTVITYVSENKETDVGLDGNCIIASILSEPG